MESLLYSSDLSKADAATNPFLWLLSDNIYMLARVAHWMVSGAV
jgi:hypothetical protein